MATTIPDRFEEIQDRLSRIEAILHQKQCSDLNEEEIEPWQFLVRRQHSWRKQLYVKGRNLTARQLVGAMNANQMNKEQAAANYHLPIEAVREALAYVVENSDLLRVEAEIERLMHQREGKARVTQSVS